MPIKQKKANREKIMKKGELILTIEKLAAVACMVLYAGLVILFAVRLQRSGDCDDRDCYGYFCTGFLSEWT